MLQRLITSLVNRKINTVSDHQRHQIQLSANQSHGMPVFQEYPRSVKILVKLCTVFLAVSTIILGVIALNSLIKTGSSSIPMFVPIFFAGLTAMFSYLTRLTSHFKVADCPEYVIIQKPNRERVTVRHDQIDSWKFRQANRSRGGTFTLTTQSGEKALIYTLYCSLPNLFNYLVAQEVQGRWVNPSLSVEKRSRQIQHRIGVLAGALGVNYRA